MPVKYALIETELKIDVSASEKVTYTRIYIYTIYIYICLGKYIYRYISRIANRSMEKEKKKNEQS